MARTLQACWNSNALTTGSTTYFQVPTSRLHGDSNQNRRETIYREAGNIQNLVVHVTANTTTAATQVVLLINGSTTTLDRSIAAGATGDFTDGSVVAVSAGDKLVWRVVAGTGGTITISTISSEFDATTNTVTRHGTSTGSVVATAAIFFGLAGENTIGDATENNCKVRIRQTGTFKNLYVRCISNAKAGNSTVTVRKNGASQTLALTIGASATGDFENTANTVAVVAGDDICIQILGTNAGAISMVFTLGFETTDGKGFMCGSANQALTIGEPLTRYMVPGARVNLGASTEADNQILLMNPYTFSQLTIHVSANTVGVTPFRFRKNGANGNQSASITASTTGYFTDTTNTDALIVDDKFNANMVTPATGGTQTMTVRSWSVTFVAITTVNIDRTAADTLTLSDSVAIVRNKTRTVSQTLTLGESATRRKAAIRPISQTLTLGEALTKSKGMPRPISQTLTLGESLTLSRNKTRTRTESLTLGESATRSKAANRSIAQTLTLSDAVAKVKGITRTAADTLILGDSVIRLLSKTRIIAQSLTLGESATRKADKTRTVSQTLTLGDSVIRLKAAARSLADTLALTDFVDAVKESGAAGIVRNLSESLTVGDSVSRKADKTRTASDTFALSDAATRSKGTIRSISQSLTLSDQVQRLAAKTRAIAQTLTLGESLTRLANKTRTLSESLSLSDLAAAVKSGGQQNITRTISETLTLGDNLTRQASKFRSLIENLILTEELHHDREAQVSALSSGGGGSSMTTKSSKFQSRPRALTVPPQKIGFTIIYIQTRGRLLVPRLILHTKVKLHVKLSKAPIILKYASLPVRPTPKPQRYVFYTKTSGVLKAGSLIIPTRGTFRARKLVANVNMDDIHKHHKLSRIIKMFMLFKDLD